MTCIVSNAEKYQALVSLGQKNCLFRPFLPRYRIVFVRAKLHELSGGHQAACRILTYGDALDARAFCNTRSDFPWSMGLVIYGDLRFPDAWLG